MVKADGRKQGKLLKTDGRVQHCCAIFSQLIFCYEPVSEQQDPISAEPVKKEQYQHQFQICSNCLCI